MCLGSVTSQGWGVGLHPILDLRAVPPRLGSAGQQSLGKSQRWSRNFRDVHGGMWQLGWPGGDPGCWSFRPSLWGRTPFPGLSILQLEPFWDLNAKARWEGVRSPVLLTCPS